LTFTALSFVTTAQEILPGMRGTVMSLASFSMVVSGAAGTFINSRIILYYSYSAIFIIAAVLLLSAGLSGYFVLASVKRISEITQYEQSWG
jgi:MFS family permease